MIVALGYLNQNIFKDKSVLKVTIYQLFNPFSSFGKFR